MSSPVQVYTTRTCAYCFAAKRLLSKRGIAYDEVDVSGDRDARDWLVATTGRRTVPQIFVAGTSIGGYEELKDLDGSGRLAQMIGEGQPKTETDLGSTG